MRCCWLVHASNSNAYLGWNWMGSTAGPAGAVIPTGITLQWGGDMRMFGHVHRKPSERSAGDDGRDAVAPRDGCRQSSRRGVAMNHVVGDTDPSALVDWSTVAAERAGQLTRTDAVGGRRETVRNEERSELPCCTHTNNARVRHTVLFPKLLWTWFNFPIINESFICYFVAIVDELCFDCLLIVSGVVWVICCLKLYF